MNTSSNVNIMETITSHHEQSQSTNDNPSSTSNNNTTSSLTVSDPVTNSIQLNYESERICRRVRAMFTVYKIHELEKEFPLNHYPSVEKRIKLADRLELSEPKIQCWFQNRRVKWRSEALKPRVELELDATTRGRNPHSHDI